MSRDSLLIKKPWITEKTTALSEIGKYVFIVKSKTTKSEVKKAVKEIYKVDPVSVNIINRPPKRKRFRNSTNLRAGYRKAIVTLKSGQHIDLIK